MLFASVGRIKVKKPQDIMRFHWEKEKAAITLAQKRRLEKVRKQRPKWMVDKIDG